MSTEGENTLPRTLAELRAARLKHFRFCFAEAEHVIPSVSQPVVSSAPEHASPSAPQPSASEHASTSAPQPSAPEHEQAALVKELHGIYMATWPVCVEMAQALRGISDLSRFKDLSFKDLKQKLLSYYPFSNIQIRRVDAYLNPKPQVTVISSSSTSAPEDDDLPVVISSSSTSAPEDDDLPMVGNGVDVSHENEALPLVSVSGSGRSKRRRIVSMVTSQSVPLQLSNADFRSLDAVKSALKDCNASCHPVCRSSAGKYVRFCCSFASSSVPCPLNISGSWGSDGLINLSPSTYVAGICFNRKCSSCAEDLVFFASCENGHRFCLECFDHTVKSAVRTNKASFVASDCNVFCTFCAPASIIDIQTHSNSLTKETWQFYLEACSEKAVLSEQRIWQARDLNNARSEPPDAIAFVGDLICRMCPSCKRYMSDDFDGCLALKCGRTVGGAGAGCGANICAYCSGVFASEMDVHQHLKTCMFNPAPNEGIYPTEGCYLNTMWDIRRERVWLYVMETLPDRIPSIWINIAKQHPELKLTPDWLENRAKCCAIAQEFDMAPAEFGKLAPQYLRCISSLKEIFTDADDEERLWRACIINKGSFGGAVTTLIDNPPPPPPP